MSNRTVIAVFFLRAFLGLVPLAPLALAAALLAIPADQARADSGHPGGSYPLHCAAGIDDDLEAVVHLLGSAHGINVDVRDADDDYYTCGSGGHRGNRHTPLHWAARYGRMTIAATLIATRADVNAKGSDGDTPLHRAAYYGHVTMAAALIAAGADVNAKSNGGDTPLHSAAQTRYFPAPTAATLIATLIAAGADVNAKTNTGWTPLHGVARHGRLTMAAALIAAGADVNVKTNTGWTPLHLAAPYGHAPIVVALIAAGANVNAKTNTGWTPLHFLAINSIYKVENRHIAAALIAAGADVNAKTNNGWTPLHSAAWDGHALIAAELIAAGADVNAKDNNRRRTPLGATWDWDDSGNRFRSGGAAVASALIAAGGHWGEACENAAIVNPNSPTPPCLCESPNVGTGNQCAEPNNGPRGCPGLTPPKFYDATAGECVAYQECPAGMTPNRATNLCECAGAAVPDGAGTGCLCESPNVGTPDACQAPSVESCGGLTSPQFYSATLSACTPFASCRSGATLNRATNLCECAGAAVPDGAKTGCLCESPNVGTPDACQAPSVESCGGLTPPKFYDLTAGECVAFKECRTGATLDRATNFCECAGAAVPDGAKTGCLCESPNLGTPDNCQAPSVEVCGELNPPKHYDFVAGECVPLATCRYEETRNTETNICECLAPNVRVNGDCRAPSVDSCGRLSPPQFYSPTLSACAPHDECVAAGNCALSADACGRGFAPGRFYDSAAGECVPFAECHSSANLNRKTNQCECAFPRLYMRPDGSCEFACARAETEAWKGNFYQCECSADTVTNVNGTCELLYPCHASAIRKADNSGCECPPERPFSHGDPSGGQHRTQSADRYGRRPFIPQSAVCHPAEHNPLSHDDVVNSSAFSRAVFANNSTLVAHYISGHGQAPDCCGLLQVAAAEGYGLAARALLDGGANVNLKNDAGNAPLHLAARNGRRETAKLLLERGADVDAPSGDGDTALHEVSRLSDTDDNVALVSLFLDKGANPNPRNNAQWRPLDVAFGKTDSRPPRRKIMAALISGGATWSDECTGETIPNLNYRAASGIADCVCPLHISERDSRGNCECPSHSHAQVNGRCLPKDSAEINTEIEKMRAELASLRAALAALNAQLSLAASVPTTSQETLEDITKQAEVAARGVALGRMLEAGPPPRVALSDTEAACRMLGGDVDIQSDTGARICSGVDINDTFCIVDSPAAFSCVGLFRHVRRCNDDFNRPTLDPFHCAKQCADGLRARGAKCGPE